MSEVSRALQALDDIRAGKVLSMKEPWVRSAFLPIDPNRRVLSFDPSLAKTGWALVVAEYPYVLETGVLETKPLDGEEGNLRRGVSIFEQALAVMERHPDAMVAHEAPPAGSSGLFRTDATKSAGLAIRIAAHQQDRIVYMTSDTHGKKRMCGRVKDVSKAQMRQAIEQFWPHLPKSTQVRWTEDIRDAVVVGILTHEEYRP